MRILSVVFFLSYLSIASTAPLSGVPIKESKFLEHMDAVYRQYASLSAVIESVQVAHLSAHEQRNMPYLNVLAAVAIYVKNNARKISSYVGQMKNSFQLSAEVYQDTTLALNNLAEFARVAKKNIGDSLVADLSLGDGSKPNLRRVVQSLKPHHFKILNAVPQIIKDILKMPNEHHHPRVAEAMFGLRQLYEERAPRIPFGKYLLLSTRDLLVNRAPISQESEFSTVNRVNHRQPNPPPARMPQTTQPPPPPIRRTMQKNAQHPARNQQRQESGISPLDPELNPFLTQQLISASRNRALSSLTVPRPDFGLNSQHLPNPALFNAEYPWSNPSSSQSRSPASLESLSPFNPYLMNSAPLPTIQQAPLQPEIDAVSQQQLEHALLQILAQVNQPAAVPQNDMYSAPLLPLQFAPPSHNQPQLDQFVSVPQDPESISTFQNLIQLLNLN
jgi:hypothetical protein